MTESTLSGQFSDLKAAIANYQGIGVDSTSWSATELATIERIIKKGLRQFYFPPQFEPNERPHQWSFLKPTVELTTVAPYETGTIAITLAGTTVTLTTGVWPSWAATHGTLVVGTTEYEIASRTSNSEIELSSAWTEDTETAATYTLYHDGNYDLPDDFGGIEGNITYKDEVSFIGEIELVGEGRVRNARSGLTVSSLSSYPEMAAVRPKEHTTTTAGQRFEIIFYPTPNDAYTFEYRKLILPQALVDTTLTYTYGGMIHYETIEASCLSIAEMNDDDRNKGFDGPHWKYFISRLTASIQADKRQLGIEKFGYNGDGSDGVDERRRVICNGRTCHITYNGITY